MIPPLPYPFLLFVVQHGETILDVSFALVMAYLLATLFYSALLSHWFEPQRERPLDQVQFPKVCRLLDRLFYIKSSHVLMDAANERAYRQESDDEPSC